MPRNTDGLRPPWKKGESGREYAKKPISKSENRFLAIETSLRFILAQHEELKEQIQLILTGRSKPMPQPEAPMPPPEAEPSPGLRRLRPLRHSHAVVATASIAVCSHAPFMAKKQQGRGVGGDLDFSRVNRHIPNKPLDRIAPLPLYKSLRGNGKIFPLGRAPCQRNWQNVAIELPRSAIWQPLAP